MKRTILELLLRCGKWYLSQTWTHCVNNHCSKRCVVQHSQLGVDPDSIILWLSTTSIFGSGGPLVVGLETFNQHGNYNWEVSVHGNMKQLPKYRIDCFQSLLCNLPTLVIIGNGLYNIIQRKYFENQIWIQRKMLLDVISMILSAFRPMVKWFDIVITQPTNMTTPMPKVENNFELTEDTPYLY